MGDAAKLMLPDIGRLRAAEGRFRGLRLVHTHVHGEGLTKDDLVDLVRLRLDLVCAIQLSPRGEPQGVSYAYNVPTDAAQTTPYHAVGPLPLAQARLDVGALMQDLEADFAKRSRARVVRARSGRAILIHVSSKSDRRGGELAEEGIRELRSLAYTAGVEVCDTIVQARAHVDPRYVLGRGKLDEAIVRAIELDCDVLIFDHDLSPTQASAIASASDLKVIDRTQLILDIFAQRAESKDGKLQVELAQLAYNMPRLSQKDDSLSRLTGGIGGRGPGETKLEIGRRRAKERVTHLEAELEKLGRRRMERLRRRARADVPKVAIVGYTNAGKSTLLNALTGAGVKAEDKLFATLDTRSRSLYVAELGPSGGRVIVTDTVGFIRDLPKDLFAAFRATFEEVEDADVIVDVVDASDRSRGDHIDTTEAVLGELGLGEIPRLVVYNKIDLVAPLGVQILRKTHPEAVCISASDPASTGPLLSRVAGLLRELWAQRAREEEDARATRLAEDRGSPSDGEGGRP